MSVTNNIKELKIYAKQVHFAPGNNELKLNENKTNSEVQESVDEVEKENQKVKVGKNDASSESKFNIQEQNSSSGIHDQTSPKELLLLSSNHQEHLADVKTTFIEPENQSSEGTIKGEIQQKISLIRNMIEQNNLDSAFTASGGLLRILNNVDEHESLDEKYKDSDKIVKQTVKKLIIQGKASDENSKTKAKKCIKLIKLLVKFVSKVFSNDIKAEKLLDCAKLLRETVKSFDCHVFTEVNSVMCKILIELQNTTNFDAKFVLLSSFYHIQGEICCLVDKKEEAISHIQKAIDILELDHNSTADNIRNLYHFYDTLFNINIKLENFDRATKIFHQFQNFLKRTKIDKTSELYEHISTDVKTRLENLENSARSSGVLNRIIILFSNLFNSIFGY